MGGDANIVSRVGRAVRAARDDADPRAGTGETGTERRVGGVLRPATGRASRRRRQAEDALLDAVLQPNQPRSDTLGAEGQLLLMRSLARLERQADVDAAIAWSLDPNGDPRVLGALPAEAAGRVPPNSSAYRALAHLDRVQRLTDAGIDPRLKRLCDLGVSAAVPIPGLGDAPSALLLVFASKTGRPLRPRTIAVLDEVAKKLEKTLTTSLALDRMTRLDGAVRRLDRLAALGGLVSEIVHEIRNPLVSVKTFLQLLPDRLDDPDFHQDFRGVVVDEVARLERMLGDLLRHARPAPTQAPAQGDARISEAVETTLQLITYRCRERGVEVVTELRDELPALGMAEDALRQLFLNLLLNASEVTPAQGRIRVVADWCPRAANHVELRVEDEGPGIDPAAKKRLFEPFFTTREDGAGGLGLSICKKIVEEAGGTIEVEPGHERGACFRISLPIAS